MNKIHRISYIYISCIKFIIFASIIFFFGNCGDKPGGLPPVEYGSLKITAVHDGIETDSVTIELDDRNLGTMENPCLLNEVEAGTHKIFASYNQLNSKSEIISIEKNILAEVTLNLYDYSPYEGFAAPDFSFQDSYGNVTHLAELRGKVVLFFVMDYT